MRKRQSVAGYSFGINSESPWKFTQRDFDWSYGYKMSGPEWKALLARAKRGDSEAEWELADGYGDGVKDDRGKILVRRSARKAAKWFRRAAEHGCVPAQNALGVLLSNGDGEIKNVGEALFWLKKAFRSGDACAAHNVALTYRENRNLRTAAKWLQKAADAGDDDAPLQLGIHYYWGKGVRRNSEAAIRCFREASEGKNISGYGKNDALFCLGLGYLEGKGVRKSLRTARKLFQRANEDNDHPVVRKMWRQLA